MMNVIDPENNAARQDPAYNVVRHGSIKQCSQAWIQQIMLNVIDPTIKQSGKDPAKNGVRHGSSK